MYDNSLACNPIVIAKRESNNNNNIFSEFHKVKSGEDKMYINFIAIETIFERPSSQKL